MVSNDNIKHALWNDAVEFFAFKPYQVEGIMQACFRLLREGDRVENRSVLNFMWFTVYFHAEQESVVLARRAQIVVL